MEKENNKNIPIEDIIKSVADTTMLSSAVIKNGKTLRNLEELNFSEFTKANKTELLIAEIFISHLPLNIFLNTRVSDKKERSDLLDLYYKNVYDFLTEYRYFSKNKKENIEPLKLFEALIQSRYPEYHNIIDNNEFYTKAIAKKVDKIISSGEAGLLTLALTSLFNLRLKTIDNFLKETSNKFKIEF